MRRLLGWLLTWVAEYLDRSLLTVPDVEEDHPIGRPPLG